MTEKIWSTLDPPFSSSVDGSSANATDSNSEALFKWYIFNRDIWENENSTT